MKKKLVLIDGNSIAYRAFYGLPLLNNDKGVFTNAVYGFTTMLMRILAEEEPSHILVAFDAGKTTFRHETFSEYKGGRQKTPPELSEQFPFIRELLDVYKIPRYELNNYEADDIIGTIALQAEQDDFEVKIISGDKDLTQLSSDKTTVYITRRGVSEIEQYTPALIKEKYGLTPEQIIDMKGLMGDSSDNIPGVPGVGEKTAIRLLKQFDTMEEVLQSIDEISGKRLKERLVEYKDQAILSKQLATIERNAPVEIKLPQLKYEGYDEAAVIELFQELDFKSLLERMAVTDDESSNELAEINYKIVNEVTDDIFASENSFYVESLDENYHYGEINGISVVNEQGNFFIPADVALASPQFKKWAEDETKKKLVYDAKRTIVLLKNNGINLRGVDFDLLLATYINNPSVNIDEVATAVKEFNDTTVQSDITMYGKGARRSIPDDIDTFAEHLVRKAIAMNNVKEKVIDELLEKEQYELFNELELPLAFILAEMESTGIAVDKSRLEEMGKNLNEKLTEISERIYGYAGEEFNINSPKQLGVILFEKLNLPVIKRTKTGYSTAADVLEKLQPKHEIIDEVLRYRQLGKLQSTYIEGLMKVISPETNKIHTIFNQALTQTGRLSSTHPNLQNIPIRLEEGRKIREAFVPSEDDWVIFAADYSQIELRVLAHISEDERLIKAFQDDMDIHTATAMDVFHADKEAVTPDMRRQAKAVNFGIVYGISDYGLSQNLGITRKEASQFIEKYFTIYPGVKQYMDEIVKDAKQTGYVTTLLQRRRYLPEITSRNFNVRSFGERTAMNTPIQGSAADIIKKAMINMAEKLKERKLKSRLLLQVHDELIFEVPEDEIDIIKQLVPEVMEDAITLKVPLKVDYSYGKTWFDTN